MKLFEIFLHNLNLEILNILHILKIKSNQFTKYIFVKNSRDSGNAFKKKSIKNLRIEMFFIDLSWTNNPMFWMQTTISLWINSYFETIFSWISFSLYISDSSFNFKVCAGSLYFQYFLINYLYSILFAL